METTGKNLKDEEFYKHLTEIIRSYLNEEIDAIEAADRIEQLARSEEKHGNDV